MTKVMYLFSQCLPFNPKYFLNYIERKNLSTNTSTSCLAASQIGYKNPDPVKNQNEAKPNLSDKNQDPSTDNQFVFNQYLGNKKYLRTHNACALRLRQKQYLPWIIVIHAIVQMLNSTRSKACAVQ